MGKSLRQLVRDYIAQLADADQAERDVAEFRRLSREAQGDGRGWKFNREEIYDRYDRAEARRRRQSGDGEPS